MELVFWAFVIHLLLGFCFCSWIARRRSTSPTKLVIASVTFITTLFSIPTTQVIFNFTPGLNRLSWGIMQGGPVAFFLWLSLFTVVYYFVAVVVFALVHE